ncbi:type II secretion system protein GspM [Kiritimatiella glycovorans]|uniref:Pilus assembly protein, PilO n=1 Tax=Kiritimatiella glycovorans TaxID=1307763 RepID=A0A0G3EBZ2_9BACT|nr:type II secretion system protein GspM [Kiritimatiella glycovorans]AKJ64001.1 hypothetical protein L21SP4_00733 [Kiritimatiella glycovorans]
MTFRPREMVLAWITLAVVLAGLTYAFGVPALRRWSEMAGEREELETRISLYRGILDRSAAWSDRLAEVREKVPVYKENISVTPKLLKDIKSIADRHELELLRTQPTPEEKAGALCEISVSCHWQGSLEAITRFLFDLQQQKWRFDIRQLYISPSQKEGDVLQGTMSIFCAYRRADDREEKQTDET